MGSKNVQLSISILLSKNIEAIKRCLASLDFLREEIACELILTDTSKQEEVHALAEEYADVLLEFEWCNDFAKARNVGLKKATGDWFLFLDDDEWIEDATPLIEFLKGQEEAQFDCVNYVQRNWHDEGGEHYSDFWVSRMIRRNENTHFESKIHEYLVPITGDCKGLRLIVNHTGYIYQTEADKWKHFKRNEPLLLEMMEAEPDILRWKTQLVQEYWAVREYKEMIHICELGIKQAVGKSETLLNRDMGTFYSGLVVAYYSLGEYENSLKWAEKAFADERTSIVCHAYIRVIMASIFMGREEYEYAEEQIKLYLDEMKKAMTLGTAYENMKCAMIAGEAFDEITVKKAYSILILCGIKRDNLEPLKKYYRELHWQDRSVYIMDGFFEPLIEGMAGSKETEDYLIDIMGLIWRNDALRKMALEIIPPYEQKNPSGFKRLQDILSYIDCNHWYPSYMRVLMLYEKKRELIPEGIIDLALKLPSIFSIPEDVIRIGENCGFSIGELYRSIPIEKWKLDVNKQLEELDDQHLPIFEKELMAILEATDYRLEYATVRIYTRVAMSISRLKEFDIKRVALFKYARIGGAYARKYYEKDIVNSARVLLPEYVRAALFFEEALNLEDTDRTRALEKYTELMNHCPLFSKVVKHYLCEKEIEDDRKKRVARKEMRELRDVIIKKAKELSEQEQFDDAISVLKEVQRMCPNDLDVISTILEVRLQMVEAGYYDNK